MTSRVLLKAIVLLILWAQRLSAAPLEAYAHLPSHEDVALSPDGKHVAFVTTVGDEREAVIQSLVEQDNGVRFKVGNQKLRGLRWPSPDHLLINESQSTDYLAGTQSEIYRQSVYDLQRNKVVNPWEFPMTHTGALITIPGATLPASRANIFLGGSLYSSPGVFRFDLDRQTKTMLDAIPGERDKGYGWMMDENGNLVALVTYDEKTQRWTLSLLRDNKWTEVLSEQTAVDEPTIVGLGPEKDTLTLNRIEDGEVIPRRVSIIDGKWGEALPKEWRGYRYLLDRQTRHLIGSVQIAARHRYVFMDSKLQQTWDRVVQHFPGEEIVLESWSDDWQKMIVRVFGTKTGAGYVLVDNSNGDVSYLGNLYAGIEATDIASVKPISYDAADGMQISGYLTLPRNKNFKSMPLIVMPHGGPGARDVLGFDWFAQALASRGYLVMQPNFRGSWGLGEKFQEAGYAEWGRKMQTDLSDGVRALVKLGIVDPKRVCIVGSSYGGYAALAGATMEADVYRCAISISGISNLKKQFYEDIAGRMINDNRSLRYDLRYLGAKNLDDPILAERSPALHADRVGGPILLIHGDEDSVVPLEQSQIMANALKKAGKSYEFVKLKSEDHWLSKAGTRLQMLQAVVKFLEINNPP